MRKRISYFCPWVTTREVIRLGFSGFLFSLLLQLCISGEEEKGKILKSRRTTYDNSKTCWLTFWKRFGIIGSTVKGSNWCCWQTKFQLLGIEVLCNDLLWGEKRHPNLAQKINEEVKLLTSIGEIMSIGTP